MGVSSAPMANSLVPHAIFLPCERQCCESGGADVFQGTGERVKGARFNPKAEVAKPEQSVQSVVGGQVFARAQQEIESDGQAIDGGAIERGTSESAILRVLLFKCDVTLQTKLVWTLGIQM